MFSDAYRFDEDKAIRIECSLQAVFFSRPADAPLRTRDGRRGRTRRGSRYDDRRRRDGLHNDWLGRLSLFRTGDAATCHQTDANAHEKDEGPVVD
jgi:hypothetical protein